jgi:cysteine desulfurase/selenocysteine lyase
VFTKGSTDSINALAFSLGEFRSQHSEVRSYIDEGDEIIVSGVEHHPEVTIQQLMAEGDAQKILEDSYYKP